MLPKSTQFFSLWFWYIQKESLGCDSIFFAPYLTANKLESNLFYKLNITLMGLCLPSLDINFGFTTQPCGKSIHLKSLMYIFQRIGVYVTCHITQAFVLITVNTPWQEIYILYLRLMVVHCIDIIYSNIKIKYRILLGHICQRT